MRHPSPYFNSPPRQISVLSFAIIANGPVDSGIFADSSYQVGRHRYSVVQVTVKSAPLGFKPLQRRVRRRVGTVRGQCSPSAMASASQGEPAQAAIRW
jgi:hypothetical protein